MSNEESKTILLVEDEILISATEAKMLQRYGFKVITALSGEKALVLVEQYPEIDLILMDINLGSSMDGTQVAELILQKHDLPLIFLSSHTQREIVDKTEGITSYGYIVKNSGETVIIAAVKMAFKLFDARRQEKIKEAALRESEERYRHVSSSISDIAYSCATQATGDYSIDWLSGAVEQITGYTPAELISMRCWGNLVLEEDFPRFTKSVSGLTPGDKGECELRIRHKNGSIRWINSRAECVGGAGTAGKIRLYGGLHDITDRVQAEESLRKNEIRYRLITENTADIIWVMDVEKQQYKYVSPSVKTLRGYTPEEVMAQPMSDSLTPESLQKVGELLGARLPQFLENPGNPVSFIDEVDQPHRDGSIINTEVTTTYLLNEQGHVEIVGISRDITARKRVEYALEKAFQEKQALLRELQHRVKNSFALIISMISMMESSNQSKETISTLADIRLRIGAMGALYDILYKSTQVIEVRLNEYIDMIVRSLAVSPNIRFMGESEPITVSAKNAAPLGLIVNELITNCIKHAFPGDMVGTVTITLKKTATNIILSVEDDGVGLPEGLDLTKSQSMGMLMVAGLSDQLNGQFRVERGNGTRCILELPVDYALSASQAD